MRAGTIAPIFMKDAKKGKKPIPILKWIGGKRQLLSEITERLPLHFERYFEPFFGGGAVLFSVAPAHAVINDLNGELMNLYSVVRDSPTQLIELLKTYPNEEQFYYLMRDIDLDKTRFSALSPIEKAARTVYLNRTCYNGVFRVNRAGHFNVPYAGLKTPNIVREEEILLMHDYFASNDVVMRCGDFEKAVQDARPGDFVYFDPPYDPLPGQSSFVGYTEEHFPDSSLRRLVSLCDELTMRGVQVMISNSATQKVRDLFSSERYNIAVVKAKRSVNSKADQRGEIDEFIITNYETDNV